VDASTAPRQHCVACVGLVCSSTAEYQGEQLAPDTHACRHGAQVVVMIGICLLRTGGARGDEGSRTAVRCKTIASCRRAVNRFAADSALRMPRQSATLDCDLSSQPLAFAVASTWARQGEAINDMLVVDACMKQSRTCFPHFTEEASSRKAFPQSLRRILTSCIG
jgi:hypothetical protein